MSISQHLEVISAAVTETRGRMAEINARLAELDGETYRIENAPPHTDDIIEQKNNELVGACLRFQTRTAEKSKNGDSSLAASLNDPDAQAYYNRAAIKAQIPNEVARLHPDAGKGMKKVDRNRALATVEAERKTLRAEREALSEEIGDLRRIVLVNGQ